MNTTLRRDAPAVGSKRHGARSGLLVFGVLLTGQFNGLPIPATNTVGQVWVAVAAALLLGSLPGVAATFVRGWTGKVAVFAMALAFAAMVAGGVAGLVNPAIGRLLVFAAFPFAVAAGTLLGISLLRTDGPRAATWLLTVSLPMLAVTDKLLWDPMATALGFDLAPILFTWPFGLGMLLLGVAVDRADRDGQLSR
ncbi:MULTISPECIES: hypothetical protein [unclassified Haladaptatus]|uniref:hypothetical protein n=1 Tax=unclassified Haladaptatus TaxID=2622732 RepID=UPI0023E84A9A|nr:MULTISPECIES: hypothetical protein [unclassified Haladaptatus]